MKMMLSITACAAVVLGAPHAVAAELAAFELMGLPITHVQVAIVGSAHVRERSPVPELVWEGMPASPHQVLVLAPRSDTALPTSLRAGVHDVAATRTVQ